MTGTSRFPSFPKETGNSCDIPAKAIRRMIPLTKDGDPDTIDNGRASWSPDGPWIAYIQSDLSAVPKRAVLVPGDPTYRTFRETRYERIGGPISTLRIGVVGVEGGPTRWIELATNREPSTSTRWSGPGIPTNCSSKS